MKTLYVLILISIGVMSTSSQGVLLQDDFEGDVGGFLNPSLWDTEWSEPGSNVSLTGTGWAQIDLGQEHTGGGFTTRQTFSNSGNYSIHSQVSFTGGYAEGGDTHWADHIYVILRNSTIEQRNSVYWYYEGPEVVFDIHTHWHTDTSGVSSVSIRERNAQGSEYTSWAEPKVAWDASNHVVDLYIDYDADNSLAVFRVVNQGITVTEAQLNISSQTMQDIGQNFKIEFDSIGWSPAPVYWDYVVVTPEPATLLLLGLGGLSVMRKRRG